MKSPLGFFAAISFLLAAPIALLYETLFGNGAGPIIHFVCGAGFALSAFSVFNFKLPRWLTWLGFVSTSALAVIFLLQGVNDLVANEALAYLALQVLGQTPERLFVDIFILWLVAVLLMDSQGKTKIFGIAVMSIVVCLEVYRSLGGVATEGLKLVYLLVFVWFLFESRQGTSVALKLSETTPES